MKLILMTDFILQKGKKGILPLSITDVFKQGAKRTNEIFIYAKFLKQPLKLEMFVPCDEDGNVFQLPKVCICTDSCSLCKKYQKEKEKVLFEGFEFFDKHENGLNNMLGNYGVFKHGDDFGITHRKGIQHHTYFNIKTIEDLIRIKQGISLTENAIKQLGL